MLQSDTDSNTRSKATSEWEIILLPDLHVLLPAPAPQE